MVIGLRSLKTSTPGMVHFRPWKRWPGSPVGSESGVWGQGARQGLLEWGSACLRIKAHHLHGEVGGPSPGAAGRGVLPGGPDLPFCRSGWHVENRGFSGYYRLVKGRGTFLLEIDTLIGKGSCGTRTESPSPGPGGRKETSHGPRGVYWPQDRRSDTSAHYWQVCLRAEFI